MSEIKFCKDCKWHDAEGAEWSVYAYCTHPSMPITIDRLVTGCPSRVYCSVMRHHSSACGPEGKLWEAK